MPTDVVSMATVGAYLSREGAPFLVLLLLGERAETVLPKVRQWMNTNSWIVSEAVILFFLVMTLTG